jgi:hypothetical protein
MEEDGEWEIQFRRDLTGGQLDLWRSLLDKLSGVTISAEDGSVAWALE